MAMHIALFHNLPSGGAKRSVHEATRRLATRHTIDVYTLASANHEFADLRPYVARHHVFPFRPWPLFGSPLGRLNQMVRLADLWRLRRLARRMAAAIPWGEYDVLLAHPCQFESSPSLLRWAQGAPTVYYCHEPLRLLYETMPPRPYAPTASRRQRLLDRLDPLPGLYRRTLRRVDRANLRSADAVLVNSQFIRESVRRIYQTAAIVSYHGVDVDCFRPLSLPRERFVLSVGSLTPLKGFDWLIRAIACIPPARRPSLVIVSNFQNPPERAFLEQLAQASGVDLRLLANISDARLVELYNQAALTAYAPHAEPFGLVPLESMACATPVVAVREGGVAESVVHEETGLLTERDPQQIAAAIERLLDDANLAERYGRSGRAHVVRHWTWEQAAATLERHLICASSGQPLCAGKDG